MLSTWMSSNFSAILSNLSLLTAERFWLLLCLSLITDLGGVCLPGDLVPRSLFMFVSIEKELDARASR